MITNEFQTAEQQQDLEALRDFIPSFETTDIEPFIRDTPVIPPTWNKVKIDAVSSATEAGTGQPQAGSERVICAVQSGSTFIPKIMIPVQGTIFENA